MEPPLAQNNDEPPRMATTADMADLLIVHLNVWTALEAIGRELPEGSNARKQIELSRQGMTNALAAIVRRHEMNISLDSQSYDERDPDPA